jgi:sugar O-acyltransferase (sialic acid O-acetyltransferase NeuD family)
MKEITVPQLGVNDEKITIVEWLVKSGESIEVNQEICTVETTKSNVSVESPYEGFIQILVDEGKEYDFQDKIAVVLDSPDEKYSPKKEIKNISEKKSKVISENLNYTKQAYEYAIKNDVNIDMIKIKRGIIRKQNVINYLNDEKNKKSEVDLIKINQNNNISSIKGCSVAIYGTGLGGKMVHEYIESLKQYEISYFINDYISKNEKTDLYGVPVIHGNDIKVNKDKIDAIACFIANNSFRLKVLELCKKLSITPLSIISTNASLRNSTRIGKGVFVKDGAVIGSFSNIGDCTVIDDNVTIAHHADIHKGCFLAPGCTLGGGVTIGEQTIISVGSNIVSKVNIGKNVIISAGSTVHNDIPDNCVVEGNPAKVIGKTK